MELRNLKYLLLIASFVPAFLIQGCSSLKKVELVMPQFVRRGGEVGLSCKHDMDIGALYAIKWYKGSQEFYRYVPKESPPIQVFPLPGIHVVMSKSNEEKVVIRDVPLEITGPFKCVVSAETTFETIEASSHLTVVVIGDARPSVELERSEYHPGDSIRAHCQTPASYPTANVTWYLDDRKIGDRLMKTDIDGEGDESVAKATVSSISFDLPHSFFDNNPSFSSSLSSNSNTKTSSSLTGLESSSSSSSRRQNINNNNKNNSNNNNINNNNHSSNHNNNKNNKNIIRIKCRATVYTVYDQYTVIPIQLLPRRLSDPHTLLRSGSPGIHNYYYRRSRSSSSRRRKNNNPSLETGTNCFLPNDCALSRLNFYEGSESKSESKSESFIYFVFHALLSRLILFASWTSWLFPSTAQYVIPIFLVHVLNSKFNM